MKITSIASSSKGCCYVIESAEYQLLIDCGVPMKRIREALNHDLSNVVGCLVSHEHGDHANFLPKLGAETSIPIYCTEGTKKRFDVNQCQIIQNHGDLLLSRIFRVLAIELSHDVPCFGFLVELDRKRLFYATDTGDIKYTIQGLTHLMIECNHSFEKLIDSEQNKAAVKRISETHLDIEQVCEFVSRHLDLEEIHLLHLSDGHSDEKLFKKMVQDVSGCPVYVAKK